MDKTWASVRPDAVLDFWFPDNGHDRSVEAHRDFWTWRMRGGADDTIREKFAELTEAAACGHLDHWADTPRGRLALIIVLDQFSRSVWRGSPAAYAQDIRAAQLALEGMDNGQFEALPNAWEKQFCVIAISHCEGPDHLQRMDRMLEIAKSIRDQAPPHLRNHYLLGVEQTELVRGIIARFGRHPHRNAILGRTSTNAEAEYIAAGSFPHERKLPQTEAELQAHFKSRKAAENISAR